MPGSSDGNNILDSVKGISASRRSVRVNNSNVFQAGMSVEILDQKLKRSVTIKITSENMLANSITFTGPLPGWVGSGSLIVIPDSSGYHNIEGDPAEFLGIKRHH